jgi:uncharacterized protein (TIGR03435 family)
MVGLLCALGQVNAQQPSPPPEFEVVSIKPVTPGPFPISGSGTSIRPGGVFTANNFSVAQLIQFAYNIHERQITGGPEWTRVERFNVNARASTDVPRDQLRRMAQTLLADRFKLRLRTETREMAIHELLLARSDGRVGPNLHDCLNVNDKGGVSTPEKPFTPPRGGVVAAADCASLSTSLVTLASRHLDSIVVDKTGLAGQWRFNIYFRPDAVSQDTGNPDLPSFIGALGEQLGLRVERTRGPVTVLVIEAAERPSPD